MILGPGVGRAQGFWVVKGSGLDPGGLLGFVTVGFVVRRGWRLYLFAGLGICFGLWGLTLVEVGRVQG